VGRCLQHKATTTEVFDDPTAAAWGNRLYGCESCQECCPHNAGPGPLATPPDRPLPGELGPSISLRRILSMDEGQRRSFFRGAAMGMSWVPDAALLRNALAAAGNSGEPSLLPQVQRYEEHPEACVRSAALRAAGLLASRPC